MDASSLDESDLARLSASDKQEMQHFLNNAEQRAQIQQRTHELTEICWKKCVTGSIKSSALDKGEQACLANCVDRFMDANILALKHLENMRNS